MIKIRLEISDDNFEGKPQYISESYEDGDLDTVLGSIDLGIVPHHMDHEDIMISGLLIDIFVRDHLIKRISENYPDIFDRDPGDSQLNFGLDKF